MIVFSWNELPTYGAKLIREAISRTGERVEVVATMPKVPTADVEGIIGQPVHWVSPSGGRSVESLFDEAPSFFFQAGWYVPNFIAFGHFVKLRGGKVVLLSDNSSKFSMRQLLGRIYFRCFLRSKFDAVWVPGQSGEQFMLANGMPREKIFTGLYGSDPSSFFPRGLASERVREILYVGRFVEEKGVLDLVSAFKQVSLRRPNWRLRLIGSGELFDTLRKESSENIIVERFALPEHIGEVMGRSRVLALPSHSDHWPLVINEGALAGCGLLVSDKVGNRSEFCSPINSRVFSSRSEDGLKFALMDIVDRCEGAPEAIVQESSRLGKKFTPTTFGDQFLRIINRV
ncbi:MAG: glycosyltransferase family 4 protein [Gammaproteobacteria bacterium]|nr:glycosyltransferase family 4 protein [Gammaproteobacteria bacterium]